MSESTKNIPSEFHWSFSTRKPIVDRGDLPEFDRACMKISQVTKEYDFLINLCADRFWFSATMIAAQTNGTANLLPQNHLPYTIEALLNRYSSSVIIYDNDSVDIPKESNFFDVRKLSLDASLSLSTSWPSKQLCAKVFTSGSTGKPKALDKSWLNLYGTGLKLSDRFDVKNWQGPILASVPSQHMYGLEMTLMLALASGVQVLQETPFFASDFVALSAHHEERLNLVTTPFHLKSLLQSGVDNSLKFENIVCATAPLDKSLALLAEQTFDCPLFEIYGCSEAGSMATRRPTHEDNWMPLDGFTFGQDNHCFWVDADHLDERVKLEDEIYLHKDGSVSLLGRSSDMLNVGGKRSSIGEITERIRLVESVEDVAVFVPLSKERPAALYVGEISARNLREKLSRLVDPVFIPRPIIKISEIPRLATGKVSKSALEKFL